MCLQSALWLSVCNSVLMLRCLSVQAECYSLYRLCLLCDDDAGAAHGFSKPPVCGGISAGMHTVARAVACAQVLMSAWSPRAA